jgi:hypothetical protein
MNAMGLIRLHEGEIRERFHVRRIGVFGSHARGEARAGSDVDVLVEFEPGQATFDNYMDLKFYLEDHFKCKVDLVTADAIKPQLKAAILSEVTYA